jgi:hypothetical protein
MEEEAVPLVPVSRHKKSREPAAPEDEDDEESVESLDDKLPILVTVLGESNAEARFAA